MNLEATLEAVHPLAIRDPLRRGRWLPRGSDHARARVGRDPPRGYSDRIDPEWRPLIASFQQFYGLGERVRLSTSEIPEDLSAEGSAGVVAQPRLPREAANA